MITETQTAEVTYFHKTEPPLAELIASFKGCSPGWNGWDRLRNNESVRFARWPGQTYDGKKHGSKEQEAFPWENASDVRVFLTDDTCNELVAVMVVAFFRSAELVEGVEQGDTEQAAYIRSMFRWLLGTRQIDDLIREVELSAQYLLTYGRCVIHPFWQREVQMRPVEYTLEQLQAVAAQAAEQDPQSVLATLPAMVMDPAQEGAAVDVVRAVATGLVQKQFEQTKVESEALREFKVTAKRARKLVQELRETGKGVIPLPYFTKNQPSATVLKPWEEVFTPEGMTDIQRGPVWQVKYFTEVELRHEALINDWDEEWVKEALTKKGQVSQWNEVIGAAGEVGVSWVYDMGSKSEFDQKIEVLYASYWQLDECEDFKWAVCTVYHAGIADKYAKHGPMDLPHRQLPYVLGLLERVDRRIDASRGLPERLASRQREMKVQRDALIDTTSISVVPPLIKYDIGMDVAFKWGPLAENTASPGREPKFMEMKTPGTGLAFELMALVKGEVDNAVGTLSADVPPTRSQTKMQMLVTTFLMMWSQVFKQEFALIEAYMPDEEWMRITGSTVPLPKGDEIGKQYDFILSFDARDMDIEHVMKQFEAITKGVLPYDKTGVVNTGKLINAQMRAINPSLAKEVVQTPAEGLEARKRKVQQDLLLMYTGNEPEYLQDANPAAEVDLKLATELVRSNPKYAAAVQEDQDFADRLQKYAESLQFNIQQQQNKEVGRVGVKRGVGTRPME